MSARHDAHSADLPHEDDAAHPITVPEEDYLGPGDPAIGDTVHYLLVHRERDGRLTRRCRAAVVSGVPHWEGADTVSLAVLNPMSLVFNTGVARDDSCTKAGTWHSVHTADQLSETI